MKTFPVIVLLLGFLSSATAQLRPDSSTVRSVSGQFVVYPPRPAYTSRFYQGNANSISLEPAVLAISAERIKQSLWRELEIGNQAGDKIHLRPRPARFRNERATIVVERVLSGWAYQVDIPDSTSPSAFLRVIVEVSLLELANRGASDRSAAIPLWLAEGIAQELLATQRIEFLLPPPQTRENGLILNRVMLTERRKDPIEQAQIVLRERAPLTFEELSWPAQEHLSGDWIDVFRSTSQLFVRQLLRLNNGRSCLRSMLHELPRTLNWQFAFLHGFNPHFQTQLDIEKWWALQLVQFTGRDLMQTWTPEWSYSRLDEIVRAPVEIRSNPLELPVREEITLQKIIRDWDGLRQRPVLQRKLQELNLIRPRVAQEFVSLVDQYREVLGSYLDKQSFTRSFFGLRRQSGPIRNRLAESTIRELQVLDAKRLAMNPDFRTEPPPTEPVLSVEAR